MRKPTNLLGLLSLLAPPLLHAEITKEVAHVVLDSNVVYRVPVALDRVTTVLMPGPIAGLEGAFISQEPSLLSRFQLSFQPGSHYFSLRAMATNVTANLNVILGREAYALELTESRQPAYVIDFARPAPIRPPPPPAVAPPVLAPQTVAPPVVAPPVVAPPVVAPPVVAPQAVATPPPARLPATIATVKDYARLRAEQPAAANAIQYAQPRQISAYPEYTVRVEEAFGFQPEAVLFLRVMASNQTAAVIALVPANFSLRVGGREFYPSYIDGATALPLGQEVQFYLMFTGAPNGPRDHLAVTNIFAVSLGRYAPPAPPRAAIVPNPAPAYIPPPAYVPPPTLAQRTSYQPAVSPALAPRYPSPVRSYRDSPASESRRTAPGIHIGFSIGLSPSRSRRQPSAFP